MKISLWSRLLDLIAPRLCCVCGRRLAMTENSICSVCNLNLPRLRMLESSFTNNVMARMFWGLAPVERAYALFCYASHSDSSNILYSLKYHDHPEIGIDMGRIMASEIHPEGFFDGIDLLVPMPLSKNREGQRGYNQSEMLALGISEITGIPYETKAIERKAFKESQTRLNKWERKENVAGKFCLADGTLLRGKHILLIDDVVTTGATMLACADAIKHLDGIRISFLALAISKK